MPIVSDAELRLADLIDIGLNRPDFIESHYTFLDQATDGECNTTDSLVGCALGAALVGKFGLETARDLYMNELVEDVIPFFALQLEIPLELANLVSKRHCDHYPARDIATFLRTGELGD